MTKKGVDKQNRGCRDFEKKPPLIIDANKVDLKPTL